METGIIGAVVRLVHVYDVEWVYEDTLGAEIVDGLSVKGINSQENANRI